MATYGYIRTSKGHDPDRPGMNPETQRRDLVNAGVPECNIHSDIDVSGFAGVAARNAWRSLDSKLQRGTPWSCRHWTAWAAGPST